MQRIIDAGRAGFYDGEVARDVVEATRATLTLDDLAASQADWVTPLSATVFGTTGWTVPPNSQGYLTLAAARVLELCEPPTDPMHPDAVHLAVEAYRAVAWERDDLVCDPARAPAPGHLLDDERLAHRAEQIDRNATSTWPEPTVARSGTTYLAVVDASGMGVSLIQSNFHGIGSGLGVGDHGFFLHNRGAGFSLEPGHANTIRRGARPLHTLSPTLWTEGNELKLVLGTRGGQQQPQLLLQLAAHIMHSGMDPAAAQELPRWTMARFGPGTASELRVESRVPTDTQRALADRGHRVVIEAPWVRGWGPVAAITVAENGARIGAADPRVVTAAAATTP